MRIDMTRHTAGRTDHMAARVDTVVMTGLITGVIAGTTARDAVELCHHVDELAKLRHPHDLMTCGRRKADLLAPGNPIFGGTLGTIGEIGPATRLNRGPCDTVLGRSLLRSHVIDVLPVVSTEPRS
jgi:hypothetical protein